MTVCTITCVNNVKHDYISNISDIHRYNICGDISDGSLQIVQQNICSNYFILILYLFRKIYVPITICSTKYTWNKYIVEQIENLVYEVGTINNSVEPSLKYNIISNYLVIRLTLFFLFLSSLTKLLIWD